MNDEQNKAVKAIVDACRQAKTKDTIGRLRFEAGMKTAAGIAQMQCGQTDTAAESFEAAAVMLVEADELERTL